MGMTIVHTRVLFLRAMSFVFLMAFTSLYLQLRGLYGSKGIIPAHVELSGEASPEACLRNKLTLVCFAPYLQLSTTHTMELVAIAGIVLAALGSAFTFCCRSILYLCLSVLYLSLYNLGETFLYFQWDSLLIETGWLCVVLAPLNVSPDSHDAPHTIVSFWLVRWLLFRLMFASGVVKLQSECPTWWGLTALTVHYESQCIPTPLAYFAHQLPAWLHKLSVVATYVIEIALPALFFAPLRNLRLLAFYGQILLQVLIIFTGNYNFFNLLTMVLCISLLDDDYFSPKREPINVTSFLRSLAYYLTLCLIGYYTMTLFNIRLGTMRSVTDFRVLSSVTFTKQQFSQWLKSVMPVTLGVGGVSLAITVAEALSRSVFSSPTFFRKVWNTLTTLQYSFIALTLFSVSLVPYSSLDRTTRGKLIPALTDTYAKTHRINLVSSYGLFRQMTGVGGRPEVILEGAPSVQGPWKEYEFPYKPGSVDRSPTWVAPHQPRLDWQMWFAALGTYQHNPWLLSLAYRLLEGEPSVTKLLDPDTRWRTTAPKYIRATKYLYFYTTINSTNWWVRKEAGEYMPTFTKDHKPLLDYLTKAKMLGQTDPHKCSQKTICSLLDLLYEYHSDVDAVVVIYSVILALVVAIYSKRWLLRAL